MSPAILGLITIIIGVAGCVGYFYGSNRLLDIAIFPARQVSRVEAGIQWAVVAFLFLGLPGYFLMQRLASLSVDLSLSPVPLLEVPSQILPLVVPFLLLLGVILFFIFVIDPVFKGGARNAGDNINRGNLVRPWLFLLPAVFALGLYLAYPVVETLRLSLTERLPGGQSQWVGLENYRAMLSEPKFSEAVFNNILWLIVVPAASTSFGLLAAQLTDRISWGNIAKSLIFMPMAISLVGAAVIFKLIYEARPADVAQIGVMNAVWLNFDGGIGSILLLRVLPALLIGCLIALVLWWCVRLFKPAGGWSDLDWYSILGRVMVLGTLLSFLIVLLAALWSTLTKTMPYGEPLQWLQLRFWNNFFLMIVLIWIQTGFAMVILSAALRGIPEETVEAAIVDGAGPFQVFFKIKVPQIMGTIVVVWTTITITVLKVFDIVFAMTNGQWETQVMANYMYDKLFVTRDWGVGSASAMVIFLMVTPILIWNVYNARKEMR